MFIWSTAFYSPGNPGAKFRIFSVMSLIEAVLKISLLSLSLVLSVSLSLSISISISVSVSVFVCLSVCLCLPPSLSLILGHLVLSHFLTLCCWFTGKHPCFRFWKPRAESYQCSKHPAAEPLSPQTLDSRSVDCGLLLCCRFCLNRVIMICFSTLGIGSDHHCQSTELI